MFKFKSTAEIDRQLEKYYNDKKKEVDERVLQAEREGEYQAAMFSVSLNKKILESRIEGAKQMADYECKFHSGMEAKKSELARLDALIEHKKEVVEQFNQTIKEKNEMINALMNLVAHLSSAKLEQIGLRPHT